MTAVFNYNTAFQRTLGWVTAKELERIHNSTVAIAGLGGLGGTHLLTLARLGTCLAGTEVLKLLLGRGRVRAAPRGLHFDAYRGRLARTWWPWGNANPIQKLMLGIARNRLAAAFAAPKPQA